MCPQRDLGKSSWDYSWVLPERRRTWHSEPLNEEGFMEVGSDSAGGVCPLLGILGTGMGCECTVSLERDSVTSGQVRAELFVLHSVSIVQNSSEKLPQEVLLCSSLVTEKVRRKWGLGSHLCRSCMACPVEPWNSVSQHWTTEHLLPTPYSPEIYSGTQVWALGSG